MVDIIEKSFNIPLDKSFNPVSVSYFSKGGVSASLRAECMRAIMEFFFQDRLKYTPHGLLDNFVAR